MEEWYSNHKFMNTVNVKSVWVEYYRGTSRLYTQHLLNAGNKMKTHQPESTK
jgi:hypothetical protein